jgi:hypothetical protein
MQRIYQIHAERLKKEKARRQKPGPLAVIVIWRFYV